MHDNRKVLEQISLEDKAKLCVGKNYWQTYDIEKINLPSMFMSDGPSGLRKQEIKQSDKTENQESKSAVCFPSGAALASSWDKEVLHMVGSSLGKKAASEEVDILLAPSMNIKRTPLCGRNFEYYSEDPFLTGELAASFIEGVQEHKVAACPKHFAVNNQETKRKAINVIIGERELREIYLSGFERAIKKGNTWCIMSSYNKINGSFPAQNHHILQNILRDEWKFDGVVISDWGAIDHIVPSIAESFNLQMPGDGGYSATKIVQAVEYGQLNEAKLDEAVLRMIELSKRTVEQRIAEAVTDEELHEAAYLAAVESMVLLKNENQILPLKKEDKVLVIGLMAVNPRFQVGGGSAAVTSYQIDQPLEYIRRINPEADYAKGYSEEPEAYDLLEEAVRKASMAEKIIVFAGLPVAYESEGYDRQKLDMPENQVHLIKRLSECNENIIVVLANGSPVSMPWLPKVKAVLECYLGGEAIGRAVADLLYGIKNPSGKLAETFPVRLEDTPAFLSFPGENNIAEYREGIFVGYRYYEKKKIKPLFPFGHGLSYTKFQYAELSFNRERVSLPGSLEVSVTVKNVGDHYGKEVVQLYIGKQDSKVIRPVKELKGFEKIGLQPGEADTVRFELNQRDFSYYNPAAGRWVAEAGNYEIMIGSSSEDIYRSIQIEVISKDRVLLPVTRNTAFGDVFDIPELNEIFMPFFDELVANIPLEFNLGDKDGQLAKAMLRGMTFSSISSYEGEALKDEVIETIINRLNEKLDILSMETE
jgi:beta-glucosidase